MCSSIWRQKPEPFSFLRENIETEQIPCHITNTNAKTHQIINDNLKNSPIFDGSVKSRGSRYCPSVEDKVFKFNSKDNHQHFLNLKLLIMK